MLAVIRLACFSYWIDDYHGGAIAAIGGALVLGAMPRIMRSLRVRDGMWIALGVALLATTRPYEGLLVGVPCAAALLWRVIAKARSGCFPVCLAPLPAALTLLRRATAPALLLLAVAGMMAYYDNRVFGDPFTLPYQINRATYASAPVFIWQAPRSEPVYRYKVMRDFYSGWELKDFLYARTPVGFLNTVVKKIGIVLVFFYGMVLFPPLIMLPRVFLDRRLRFLLVTGGVFGIGLSLNAWLFPHYVAPFTCALYAILLQAMRHLRVWRPFGLAVVRITPLLCLILAGLRLYSEPAGISISHGPYTWYGTAPAGLARSRVKAKLEEFPGAQLAIVRYRADHAPFEDWVYNAADIDKSKVVWAREMESRNSRDLLRYFAGRNAWLVEPDENPPRISPYPRRAPEVVPDE
jgi:hypothetical protein